MAKPQPTSRNSEPSKGTNSLNGWCDKQAHGVKQRLAAKMGVSNGTVSHILAGRIPSLEQAIALYDIARIPYRAWVTPA